MTLPAKQAMPNQPENIGQVFNSTATAAKTATSASRKSDLPTCMGGDRNDWHNHFLAAVRKTMNRRIRDMRVQHRQRYSRFAGVLSTMVMLIGFSLLTTTVASAKTITVTGTGDTIAVDGVITLREAMTAANFNSASGDAPAGDPGLDTIKFNIPGAGVHTITLTSQLPAMNDVIIIDGTSQPGFAGIPLIEINGNNVSGTGFYINGGSSAIKSLIINHFDGRGIILAGGDGNAILGNYIGTNAAGTAAIPNTWDGILIGSSNNVIGGSGGNRNVISGNGDGIVISGDANTNFIRGNYIGTNAAGTAAIGNGSFGVRVFTSNNEIGGVGLGNVISGNGRGVSLESPGTGNIVSGNFIGTNATGTSAIPNLQDGVSLGAANNTIGGVLAGQRNIISGNTTNGVIFSAQATGNFVQGNYIGTNAAGTAAIANGSYGIRILDATNNLIGGTTAAARNIISGNSRGVAVGGTASSNTIQGNYIGLNAAGTAKLANNGAGVELGASNNLIGGAVAGAGNVISGNTSNGIGGVGANNNQIKGNLIGTNAAGTAALGNSSTGIRLINSSNNTIGGTTAAERNIISGNGGGGISIENANSAANLILGNFIGVDISGNAKLANNGSGVAISGVNNIVGSTVAGSGNLISGNAYDGIDLLTHVGGNKIQGNLIGTNAAGTAALGNTSGGIRIIDAFNSLIGGTDAGARNIISANFRGVTIEGDGGQNTVQGNYIGTDITGTVALGNNQEGMWVANGGNTVGGTVAAARNLISGNSNGIRLDGVDAINNVIQGNFIGTKANGVSPLPNTFLGVAISGASQNMIGGTAAGAGNTVAENGYAGVVIGVGVNNAVLGNSIFNNARLGIELEGDDALGLLVNDPGDSDFGANGRQNYPLLSSVIASGGNTSFQGNLNSNPNKQFRIEFFSNPACDGSGFGEGRTFLGSTSVNTDANGNAAINVSLPVSPVGNYVTATATSPDNDTSEFSPCALVGGPNPGVLQFASSFFIVEEAQGTAKIMVTRSNGMTGAVSVNYATSNGSATTPADYAATSGTLNFADGEVIKTFDIPVVDDGAQEPQENVVLTLSVPTGGATLGANTTSSLLINSSDPATPGVMFSDATVVEGDNGTTNMVFTISVTPHSVPVTVGYKTINGSAIAGSDYQSTIGQLLFNPGENAKPVSVPVFGDTVKEGDEVFFLGLTSLSVGYFIDSLGDGLITDDDGVSKFHFSSPTFNVNEDGTSINITVQRVGDTSQAASVNFATSNGSATAGQDYSATSGTLSFAAGQATKVFPVSVTDDPDFEGNETVNLTLSNPSAGGQLNAPSTAVLTVVDNDQSQNPLPGTLAFTANTYSVNENAGQATVTVSRTGGSTGAVSVQYSIANGGSATANDDYTPVSGTLTWTNGDASAKTFNVPIADDSLDEPVETFDFVLTNPTGGASLGNPDTTQLNIVDNDAPPTISINDSSRQEGDSGTEIIGLEVTLSAASGQTVTVEFTTADGTAIFGNDYQPASGTLTFAPGEINKQVEVLVNGDTTDEADETFVVKLSNPTNASLDKKQGVGTIFNDDSPTQPSIEFAASDYSVQEDLGALTITVTRTGDTSGPASVDYWTNDGVANQKSDFEFAAGTLKFAPGETTKVFQLLINEDIYSEGNEVLTVSLGNPNGAILGQQSTTTIAVMDDAQEPSANSIDDAQSFVYMQYHDFLNREPDAPGLAFWTNEITSCGGDQGCIDAKRVNVSAAFFLSIEFQETGFLVERAYRAAYGNMPGLPVPLTLKEFVIDSRAIGEGVIVNQGPWQQTLEANKQAFMSDFVQRTRFLDAYPDSMTPAQFVDTLFATSGIMPSPPERQAAIDEFAGAATSTDTAARGRALRRIAENQTLVQQEFNRAFVLMQYFGYLRRNPNDAPEPALNFDGYNFWLSKLNQFGGNYIDAEMVKAFITSIEYRQRFGP